MDQEVEQAAAAATTRRASREDLLAAVAIRHISYKLQSVAGIEIVVADLYEDQVDKAIAQCRYTDGAGEQKSDEEKLRTLLIAAALVEPRVSRADAESIRAGRRDLWNELVAIVYSQNKLGAFSVFNDPRFSFRSQS